MSTQTAQMVNHESVISDFPFIAHDGAAKERRRQIPSFVRAHVMERYHRERRAKKGIKDNGNPVWSQHEFVASAGREQILIWDEEKVIPKVRPAKKKAASPRPGSKQSSRTSQERESTAGKKGASPREVEDDLEAHELSMALERVKKYKETHLSCNLTPSDVKFSGGRRLIKILDNYYGVLDPKQKESDPWHAIWIPFAFSDPIVFHASLAKFPLHFAAIVGALDVSAEFLKHKGIAMQEICERIRNPSQKPTDQMIAAVLCLMGSEIINNNLEALKAHLRGVRQMVALRGGVRALGDDGILISGYLSYEYIVAAMAREVQNEYGPGLSSLGVPDPDILALPAQYGIFTLRSVFIDPTMYGFTEKTVLFLTALCSYLSISDVFIDYYKSKNSKSLEDFVREFQVNETGRNYNFDEYSQSGTAVEKINKEDHILKALLLTATIQFPQLLTTPYPTLGEQIRKLHYHLSQTNIQQQWKPLPGALLWCFMVGTGNSGSSSLRPWFIANMIRLSCGIGFVNIGALRTTMATFSRLARQQEEDAGTSPWRLTYLKPGV